MLNIKDSRKYSGLTYMKYLFLIFLLGVQEVSSIFIAICGIKFLSLLGHTVIHCGIFLMPEIWSKAICLKLKETKQQVSGIRCLDRLKH